MPSPAADLLGAGPLINTGLGLGSNIGDKAGNIARALQLLEERGIIRLTAVSSIYRTAPWGYVEQDFFANACAVGETRLPPLELLAATNAVETEMGRKPSIRWGPRLIDIDILFHGDASFAQRVLCERCDVTTFRKLDGLTHGQDARVGFSDDVESLHDGSRAIMQRL